MKKASTKMKPKTLAGKPSGSGGGKRPPADPDLDLADKVRNGEYFREARVMFDTSIHDPMSERYLYVLLTVVSIVVFYIAIQAQQDFYPLNSMVPIIINGDDNGEDLAHIQPLMQSRNDTPKMSMLRFLVKNYVKSWEEYDIQTFDRNAGSVKTQSSPELANQYNNFIDPHNPESPITLYQRHSKRKIEILSMREGPESMEVIFEAAVDSRSEIKKSRWRANISFQFGGLALDEKTNSAKPVRFVVTEYHSIRLQDVK